MDSVILLERVEHNNNLREGNDTCSVDVFGFKDSEAVDVRDYLHTEFGDPKLYALEVVDAADFPEELLDDNGQGPNWAAVIDYYKAARSIEDQEELDAFKALFVHKGTWGDAESTRNEFDNYYRGKYATAAEFAQSEMESIPSWVDPWVDWQGMGESFCAGAGDYYVLEDKYYFRR